MPRPARLAMCLDNSGLGPMLMLRHYAGRLVASAASAAPGPAASPRCLAIASTQLAHPTFPLPHLLSFSLFRVKVS